MALVDSLNSMAIDEIYRSTTRFTPPIDYSPDNICILANWGMAYAEKVLISGIKPLTTSTVLATQASEDYAIFGKTEMYPPELRSYSDDKNYVLLDSSKVFTKIDGYYCYALELLLDKTIDNTNNVRFFDGYGAFSMAYNPQAATTPRYAADPNNLYPRYGGADVYLKASLTWGIDLNIDGGGYRGVGNKNTTAKLMIDVVSGIGGDRQEVATVFAKQITGVGELWGDRSEDGILGSWDDSNSTYQIGYEYTAGIINDVQLISSTTIDNLAQKESSTVEKRILYLNKYAFDYQTFVSDYLLNLSKTAYILKRPKE